MQIWNTETRYGVVSKLFHWIIGLAIIGMLAVGLYMEDLPASPDKYELYGLHKSTGLVILFLVALRILWRWGNIVPKLDSNYPKWQRLAARGAHYAMYFLMVAMPLSGWLMSSAGGHRVTLYGWVTVPALVDKTPEINKLASQAHGVMGNLFIAIIILHVVAGLVHHFYYKDDVLKRMLPFVK